MLKFRKNQVQDPGFGVSYGTKVSRTISKSGHYNITRKGLKFNPKNTYHYLLNCSWTKFISWLVAFYIFLNTCFALLYCFIGLEHLGLPAEPTFIKTFEHAFFFSTQTFTTVGYGLIAPHTLIANCIASTEALIGLSGFAFVTGLLYGRFSRPSAELVYSDNMIIAPYKDHTALMFRVANGKKSEMMEMEANLLMVTNEIKEDGMVSRQYFQLHLETSKILFFPLSWTVVHPIDTESPFYGLSETEIKALSGEILILIKGFDDTFSQNLYTRHSFTFDEILYGKKFVSVITTSPDGEVVFDMDKMNDMIDVPI
jgi:inward rectifier potassium channel